MTTSKKDILKRFFSETYANYRTDDIAIIGVSGSYPEAENIEEFWNNLESGKNCIKPIPGSRWDLKQYSTTNRFVDGKTYCNTGGFLTNYESFDNMFFNISPNEANWMDPQERIFLQTSYHCFEDAGYPDQTLTKNDRNVGVFVGVMNSDYDHISGGKFLEGQISNAHCAPWSISNRVSYLFNLNGPSLTVNTACSSSLTAVHYGCVSLLNGECKVALAGGVNLILHPNHYLRLASMNMLSKNGACFTFSEKADGYVPGEGVGAVLLKPLRTAMEENDKIYAIIKSSSINSGGHNGGYTVPNPNAQASLIEEAINKADINPETIGYVEAHGTGTSLGDPIEVTGLTKAFSRYTTKKQYCSIGSVKSNIGHLESAAGIASLTKCILSLKNKTLVKSINSKPLSSKIKFNNTPFYVQTETKPWPRFFTDSSDNSKKIFPRRAAVSSFGAGGTNVHVILEEFLDIKNIKMTPDQSVDDSYLFLFSGKSKKSLKLWVKQFNKILSRRNSIIDSSQKYFEHKRKLVDYLVGQLNLDALQLNESVVLSKQLSKNQLKKFIKHIREQYEINENETMQYKSLDSIVAQIVNKKFFPDKKELYHRNVVKLPDFKDYAFTLMYRRNQYDYRLAFTASSFNELGDKLTKWIDSIKEDDIFDSDSVQNDNDIIDKLFDKQFVSEIYRILYHKNELKKLALLWVSGVYVNWNEFEQVEYHHVELPPYAFENISYGLRFSSDPSVSHLTHGNNNTNCKLINKNNSTDLPIDQGNHLFSEKQLNFEMDVIHALFLEKINLVSNFQNDGTSFRAPLSLFVGSRLENTQGSLPLKYLIKNNVLSVKDDYLILSKELFKYYSSFIPYLTSRINLVERAFPFFKQIIRNLEYCVADKQELSLLVQDYTKQYFDVGVQSYIPFSNLIKSLLDSFSIGNKNIPFRVLDCSGWFSLMSGIIISLKDYSNIAKEIFSIENELTNFCFENVINHNSNILINLIQSEINAIDSLKIYYNFDLLIIDNFFVNDSLFEYFSENFTEFIGEEGIIIIKNLFPCETIFWAYNELNDLHSELSLSQYSFQNRVKKIEPLLSKCNFVMATKNRYFTVFQSRHSKYTITSSSLSPNNTIVGVKNYLKNIVSDILGVNNSLIEDNRTLEDYGMDSVALTKILLKVKIKYGDEVSANDILDNNSIELLSNYLTSNSLKKTEVHNELECEKNSLPELNDAAKIYHLSQSKSYEVLSLGSGEPVFVITGLAFTSNIWEYQLTELKGNFKLIFPHLPGHQGTKYDDASLTFAMIAQDIVQIADKMGIEKFHLIGWSMGGYIAQELAYNYQDRLESLSLICTTPTDARARGLIGKDLVDYSYDPLENYLFEMQNMIREDSEYPFDEEQFVSFIRKCSCPIDKKYSLKFIDCLYKFNSISYLSEINIPCLVISGQYDIAFPPEQVTIFHSKLQNSVYKNFSKSGHIPFYTEAKEFNIVIKEFLTSLNGL